ncbi:triose-phosphate isomerase [Yunchengibacter salinarum]|uniref:triose-phosphate isomerase n=1 Tax=Yunchengibacter salinarum TaxID=3133399 RepID=UPI0035B57EF8
MAARPLVVGNWKMNGTRAILPEVEALARGVARAAGDAVGVALCPPFTLIDRIAARLADTPVAVGAQTCHVAESGAHTGDVSAAMVRDLGAVYVIVGHSERRSDHGETSETVAAQVRAALGAGLVPIVCVGETLAEREAGRAEATVSDQLDRSLPHGMAMERLVIAYEPVWAIGTGRTADVADVSAMHRHVRAALMARFGQAAASVPVLYGGSVKPDNAAGLIIADDVGGFLVGGASLKAADFLAIIDGARAVAE